MKTQTMILLSCVLTSVDRAAADDLDFADKPDPSSWRQIDTTRQTSRGGDHWAWRTYTHEKNGDLLTVACLRAELSVGSADLVDRSYEFAASGHPWVAEKGDLFVSSPGCTDEFVWQLKPGDGQACPLPVLQFVHTSELDEDETKTLMLSGFIFVHRQRTYFVQHTSSRPITVWVALNYARQLATTLLKGDDLKNVP
ncbi:MAG: hypothetical protein NXI04_15715 [Planctomycetaceae bacterium]|nr:hypothetical protein [Planctomycetaceae bacterium]